jgi:phosphatidate cytidylyltransferase
MKQRIVTGLLAGVVFLTLLFLGGYWFCGLMVIMAIIGYREYLRMNRLNIHKISAYVGLAGLLITVLPWRSMGFAVNYEFIWWLLLLVLFAYTVYSKNKVAIDQVALLFAGVVYIGYGFHAMIAARLVEHGLFWTLLVFICIWATDSGAYFTGYAMGKHLLWPAISPKKTVEGSLGGIVLAIVAAIIFSLCAPHLLTIGKAIELGLAIGIIGQIGDLIQSAYKRAKGIKDTGNILPGHGGILDRVDSWLIVFPFLHVCSLVPF